MASWTNEWLHQRDNVGEGGERDNQYSRRECLEITGVPDSISNDDLEETTIKMFDKLDVAIDP